MPRLYQYKTVKKLPGNAITVKQYAVTRGCSHTLIYKELKRGKAKFEIVQFHGINFIIPLAE